MIDFRYHIVSLIAVFLALGIGIVMGTTVVNEAIVNRQDSLLGELNKEVRHERSSRRDLESQVADWEAFGKEGKKTFVTNRLQGQQVTAVVGEGANRDLVTRIVDTYHEAGAVVPVIVELTDKLNLTDADARMQLAQIMSTTETRPEALQAQVTSYLATKLAGSPLPTAPPASLKPDILTSIMAGLADKGFIKIQEVDAKAGVDPNSLGATSLATIYGDDTTTVSQPNIFVPLGLKMAAGGHTLAVAPSSKGNDFVAAMRADKSAVAKMSTVDNVDSSMGLITSVFAQVQTLAGKYEQLGTGPGASSVFPTMS